MGFGEGGEIGLRGERGYTQVYCCKIQDEKGLNNITSYIKRKFMYNITLLMYKSDRMSSINKWLSSSSVVILGQTSESRGLEGRR